MCSSQCPTNLEMAVVSMFGVYMTHQDKNGKLTKEKFLNLLKEELPALGGAGSGDEIFKTVDLNEDGVVDFKEFATLVASCAMCSYDELNSFLQACEQKE